MRWTRNSKLSVDGNVCASGCFVFQCGPVINWLLVQSETHLSPDGWYWCQYFLQPMCSRSSHTKLRQDWKTSKCLWSIHLHQYFVPSYLMHNLICTWYISYIQSMLHLNMPSTKPNVENASGSLLWTLRQLHNEFQDWCGKETVWTGRCKGSCLVDRWIMSWWMWLDCTEQRTNNQSTFFSNCTYYLV